MIHPTAIIHQGAYIEDGVRIGPYSVIGDKVQIARGTVIGPHVVIEGECTIAEGCMIYPHAVLGTPPQDMKYKGGITRLEIGANCSFREFCSVNRGTEHGGGVTSIGNNCLLMANSHVAHDCKLGNNVVLANSVALAGHVEVSDKACFGGLAGVHQFVRIGELAFIAAGAMVRKDVIPYATAMGDRAKIIKINEIGLKRDGYNQAAINRIKAAYKILKEYGTGEEGIKALQMLDANSEEINGIRQFLNAGTQGFMEFA